MADGCNGAPVALRSPERNKYAHGMLMGVRQFRRDTDYAILHRRLMVGLGLGKGVLCGLEVTALSDGRIAISPGVGAVQGQTIVVPEPVTVDPAQPTDCCGRPDGARITTGDATICLRFHECPSDPVVVRNTGCETRDECVPSSVRERYLVQVRRDLPQPRPGLGGACQRIFPPRPPAAFDRHAELLEALDGPCSNDEDGCLVLATVSLSPGQVDVDDVTHRHLLLSNERLLDLILCLANRIDACCGIRPPRITAVTPAPGGQLAGLPPDRIDVTLDFDADVAGSGIEPLGDWVAMWWITQAAGQNPVATRLAGRIAGSRPDPAAPRSLDLAFERLAVGGGSLASAFGDELQPTPLGPGRYVLQVRSDPANARVVGAVVPGQALDAEYPGTLLTPAELSGLWNANDPGVTDYWDRLVDPSSGRFPSGDGQEGGNLHVVFEWPEDTSSDIPPRLTGLWLPNGTILAAGDQSATEEGEWWRSWLQQPRIELSVDRELTMDPLRKADTWMRVWRVVAQGSAWTLEPIAFARDSEGLVPVQERPPTLPEQQANTTYVFPLSIPENQRSRSVSYLVQIRLDEYTVQAAHPPDLGLDADFLGTDITDPAVLSGIWDGTTTTLLEAPMPVAPSRVDADPDAPGPKLFDLRAPGGLVHAIFTVSDNQPV
jgi:hypothetical protein